MLQELSWFRNPNNVLTRPIQLNMNAQIFGLKKQLPQFTLPFGDKAAHMTVDFTAPSPIVVTDLLCHCLLIAKDAPIAREDVWKMTVTQRLQYLLAIVMRTDPRPLVLNTQCPHCREDVALELLLEDFIQEEQATTLSIDTPLGDKLHIHVPTGIDQRNWLDGEWSMDRVARSLIGNEESLGDIPLTEGILEDMAKALEQADPLSACKVKGRCPSCEQAQQHPVDLEQMLLLRLQGVIVNLLKQIHLLASRYHWTENQILEIPRVRRDFYMNSITREDRSQP